MDCWVAISNAADSLRSSSRTGLHYLESFNGRLRDECLNEHWFTSLSHARAVIETWRVEYNDERPKKILGGLTPAQYAMQLAIRAVTMPENSKAPRY